MNSAATFKLPTYGEPALIQEFAKTPAEIIVHWPLGAFLQMRLGRHKVVHFQSICSTLGREKPDGFYTELCTTLRPRFMSLGVPCATCEPADEFSARILASRGMWTPIEYGDASWWIWWLQPWNPDAFQAAQELVEAVQEERWTTTVPKPDASEQKTSAE